MRTVLSRPLFVAILAAVPLAAVAAPPVYLAAQDAANARQSADKQQADAMSLIAEAADRMASPEGLRSVLELVAIRDRERIQSKLGKLDLKPHAKSAEDLKRVWREKFREDFDATKNFALLNGTRVELRGGQGDDKQYAFIYFPAFGGWKPFEMHLTRNADSVWRIQLPDDLTAERLVKESSYDVQKLVNDKDRWFTDKHLNYNSVMTQLVHAMAFPSDEKKK